MRKLSNLLALTHALFGRNATKAPPSDSDNGLTNLQVWCRTSVLLLLRERERVE